jgi:hypothetical protein
MQSNKPNPIFVILIISCSILEPINKLENCFGTAHVKNEFWFNEGMMIVLKIFKFLALPTLAVFMVGYMLMIKNNRIIDQALVRKQLSFIAVMIVVNFIFIILGRLTFNSPPFYAQQNFGATIFNLGHSISILCQIFSIYFFYLILKKAYAVSEG